MKSHSKDKVLAFVRKNKIITSSELAEALKISWNTADKWLLEFAIDGKVNRIKKTGVNLWTIK